MPDFSAMPEVFVSNANRAAAVSREVKGGTLRNLWRWSRLIYLAP